MLPFDAAQRAAFVTSWAPAPPRSCLRPCPSRSAIGRDGAAVSAPRRTDPTGLIRRPPTAEGREAGSPGQARRNDSSVSRRKRANAASLPASAARMVGSPPHRRPAAVPSLSGSAGAPPLRRCSLLRTEADDTPAFREEWHLYVDPAKPASIIHAPCPCGGIGRRA
jgi:hypothetical protein